MMFSHSLAEWTLGAMLYQTNYMKDADSTGSQKHQSSRGTFLLVGLVTLRCLGYYWMETGVPFTVLHSSIIVLGVRLEGVDPIQSSPITVWVDVTRYGTRLILGLHPANEAVSNLPPLCRRRFSETFIFLNEKLLNLDSNFTDICLQGSN